MSTNTKISTVVSRQLPEFVRAEHPTFVAFLQAYYEYLEQSNTTLGLGKTIERAKNLTNYFDVDKINESGLTEFNEKLFSQFMTSIPEEALADRSKLIKHVKDFYRAGGTEKSYNFLFRILFGEESEYYYPKTDILFASSGKWLIEKSIRLTNTKINGVANSSVNALKLFQSTSLKGNNSLASAKVERVQFGYENNFLYNEFYLSGLEGNFELDEEIFCVNTNGDVLTGNVVSGYVVSVTVTNGGTNYQEGSPVSLISATGSNAVATIASVSKGNIQSIFVNNGGVGFRSGDFILFPDPPGFVGQRANAFVQTVVDDGSIHPSSYSLTNTSIEELANTAINAYSNGHSGNANTSVANTLTFFSITGLGPVSAITVDQPGEGYLVIPSANVIGNSYIRSMGIVGKIRINDAGYDYVTGEILKFRNVLGGYGFGANATIVANGTGAITDIVLTPWTDGYIIGGTGYNQNFLPKIEIETTSGIGANLEVESLLGYGDILTSNTGTVGEILSIRVDSTGTRYETPPIVDLTGLGDGNANAYANIAKGILTAPGRFIDDTGKISSSSFLQDRDYYQRYSYVTKVRRALTTYKKHILDLLHPAGAKLWAEFVYDPDPDTNVNMVVQNTNILLTSASRVNALHYNASSVIYKTTPLTRVANTPNGTVTLWFNPDKLSMNVDRILFAISDSKTLANSPKLEIRLVGSNTSNQVIRITGRNTENVVLFNMTTNSRNKIVANDWNSLLATWDLTNTSNNSIYLNEINSTNLEPNIIYTGNSYNTNIQNIGANGVFFKPDGTRMYIARAPYEIIEYSLGNSWNIQSATFVGNTVKPDPSFPAIPGRIRDLFWRNDGRRLYVTEQPDNLSTSRVVSYFTSDSWNIRSINLQSGSTNFVSSNPIGLYSRSAYFREDGKYLYNFSTEGANQHLIVQRELNIPWELTGGSTITNTTINLVTNGPGTSELTIPTGIVLSTDGKKLYLIQPNSKIHLFTMNTAWNIQSSSYDRTYDLGDHMNRVEGVYYYESNGKMYIVGSNTRTNYGDSVREYTTLKANTLINDRIDNSDLNKIFYGASNVTISGTAGQNNRFLGCLAEVWFTDNHVDLANLAIRNRFFNNFNPGAAALAEDLSIVSLIEVEESGAGFRVGDYIDIVNPVGFTGVQANARVSSVTNDGLTHPTSYLITNTAISEHETTQIASYSNGALGNANTSLGNTLTFWSFSDTGPVSDIEVLSRGQNYNLVPKANVLGNTAIKNLGIIGKIRVVSQGSNYANGDIVKFRNVIGGYGSGANANVVVDGLGQILRIQFTPWTQGYIIGGTGYKEGYFPQLMVESATGTGANLEVKALLGNGDSLIVTTNDYSFGTGAQPIVYMRSNVATANVNSGIGGDFDFANNLVICDSSPSDI